ncbi:hypothetical protein GXN74_12185 [Clostridiales bacterium F-3ap]|uniref:Uncharacterized protein n=2 Tax=Anaerotalea alkaliphila TaxID=2662126 RepID=A0A7X5HXJ3_9FIRM|nr:hypothetical protein [Anaerotalea alkaliphila]
MFSQKIVTSAKFLRMPVSSQNLYFHLAMNADDDGVVEAFIVMRQVGASEDDLRVLTAKGYVIVLNEDLVSFITDWKEHNLIRADRKVDSMYKELLVKIVPEAELLQKKQRADAVKPAETEDCGQMASTGRPDAADGPHRLGKVRLGEVRLGQDSSGEEKTTREKKTSGKKSGAAKPRLEEELPAIYEDHNLSETMVKAMEDFVEHRKAMKKPMTALAVKMLLDKLEEMATREVDQVAILHQSIVNGWQGIFELKKDTRGSGPGSRGNVFLEIGREEGFF